MKSIFIFSLSVFILFQSATLFAQNQTPKSKAEVTQNIYGLVQEKGSGLALPGAKILLKDISGETILGGAFSDSTGRFTIKDVPVGRYQIEAGMEGYSLSLLREVTLSSGKPLELSIQLEQRVFEMEGVVLNPELDKAVSLNEMTTVSSRMLSVEEAQRYAGGFDDPARLASAFAGVASNVGDNGIVVRGNAPKSLQWKMEDIEIPNPNHFADLSAFGGGGITALSSQMLANSDFLTSAFPAEYTNALSGVFDIKMREGSRETRSNSFQIGLIGIDAGAEGPFVKGKGSTYLFNYRYSTLGLISPLLPEDAGGTKYQDLSFKLKFPTKAAGTFSLWGIGLLDQSGQSLEPDSANWRYYADREAAEVGQWMGAAGVGHKILIGQKTNLKTSLAVNGSGLSLEVDRADNDAQVSPFSWIRNSQTNIVLKSQMTNRFGPRHTNKTGLTLTGLVYDLGLGTAPSAGDQVQTLVDEEGSSLLFSWHSSSKFRLNEDMDLNLGLAGQRFFLNGRNTIEPRAGFAWRFRQGHQIGLGYGLHSRLERLSYYFTTTASGDQSNQDLGFSKAHHMVASYSAKLGEHLNLKVEPWFQHLFQIPVVADSSYSFINLGNDWFLDEPLINDGLGRNYGLDLTLEKYMHRGYYFLVSASLFDSKYQGGDAVWRNTRYNRNYLLNVLGGKEWAFGKSDQNAFGLNLRLSYQGGDRISPVDRDATLAAQEVIYDETNAFADRKPDVFLVHFTANCQINRPKVGHTISLKMLNATGTKEFYGYRYNLKAGTIDAHEEALIIPNLSYKIEF